MEQVELSSWETSEHAEGGKARWVIGKMQGATDAEMADPERVPKSVVRAGSRSRVFLG